MRGLVGWLLLVGCDGVFGISSYSVPDAAPSRLLAWYPLDESTGTTFTDASGRGHIGTCTSPRCPVAAVGHIDGAMRFDGVDDRIDISGDGELETTAGFTVAFWLWVDDLSHGGCPVNKQYGAASSDSWQLCLSPSGEIILYTDSGSVISTSTLATGSWHHLALRHDGSEAALLLDGTDVGVTLTSILYDADPVTLGSDVNSGQPTSPITGMLDDVRIYDHALSSGEIRGLAAQ